MNTIIRFWKRILASISNKYKKFWEIVRIYSNNWVIIIISYIFLAILFYFFVKNLRTIDVVLISISAIFSFAIFTYISDKYKYSNIKFIRILQKFVFKTCLLSLIGIILYLFDFPIFSSILCDGVDDSDSESGQSDNNEEQNKGNDVSPPKANSGSGEVDNNEKLNKDTDIIRVSTTKDDKDEEYYSFKVKKDTFDKVVVKTTELATDSLTEVVPNLGVGAAAGKAAVEVARQTSGLPPLPRLAAVGGATLVTAAGTSLGIHLANAAIKNNNLEDKIDSSKLEEGRTSPSDFDKGFINSILEENEIPLIIMVNGLYHINCIELSLILSLFSLLMRHYLIRKLKKFILKFKNKEVESINDENVTLNKVLNIGDKYLNYIIVFIFICLFWVKFINLYFSNNLAENIDSYVKVYNHVKSNSMLCLLLTIKYDYIVWTPPCPCRVVPPAHCMGCARNNLWSRSNSPQVEGNATQKNINRNFKYPLTFSQIKNLF